MAAQSGAHALEVRREWESGYPDFPLPNQVYDNSMFRAGLPEVTELPENK
jgi:hypothetical protein